MKFPFTLILIVSALLVSGASENNPSSVQPIAEKEKSLSKEQKAGANQEQGSTKSVPILILDKPSAPIGNQKTEDDRESAKQPVPSITDWIIAGVTTAYAIFALLQWRAIRRQVNLERPWIMVKPGDPNDDAQKAVDYISWGFEVNWTAHNVELRLS